MRQILIAIDGPSGAGKSTLAKAIAGRLGIMYLDTGALFRALAYGALKAGLDPKSLDQVREYMERADLEVTFGKDGQHVFIQQEDVTSKIRTPEVSLAASDISVHPIVRDYILTKERELAKKESFVLDGRDIGTVVLPQADVKIFLTASAQARAGRRLIDLEKSKAGVDYQQVLADLQQRDQQDKNRKTAPTRQADDAVLLDSTHLSLQETIDQAMAIIRDKLVSKGENLDV